MYAIFSTSHMHLNTSDSYL